MTLQAVLSREDPRLYDPNRDCAHNFPRVVRGVLQLLSEERWKYLTDELRGRGYTNDDLSQAMEKYVVMVRMSLETEQSFPEAYKASGWAAVPEPLKVAIAATLGAQLTVMYFHGSREASLGPLGPPNREYGLIQQSLNDAQWMLGLPPWRRGLVHGWRDLSEWMSRIGRRRS
jgi:hypothetical protein